MIQVKLHIRFVVKAIASPRNESLQRLFRFDCQDYVFNYLIHVGVLFENFAPDFFLLNFGGVGVILFGRYRFS